MLLARTTPCSGVISLGKKHGNLLIPALPMPPPYVPPAWSVVDGSDAVGWVHSKMGMPSFPQGTQNPSVDLGLTAWCHQGQWRTRLLLKPQISLVVKSDC